MTFAVAQTFRQGRELPTPMNAGARLSPSDHQQPGGHMSTSPEICLWVIDALRTNSATPERILSTIRCAPDGKTFCRPCLDRFDSVAKTQTCRSTSPGPEYLTCERERGHPRRHRNQTARATKRWDGGIKTSAVWVEPSDGYVSQGEWDALPKALR